MKVHVHSLVVASLILAAPGMASEAGSRLTFVEAGFSIEALDSSYGGAGGQPLLMSLPPVGGFAPNVNVAIQQFGGGIQDYVDLTLRQLVGASFELRAGPDVDGSRASFEYAGSMNGRALHWYATVVQSGTSFYLTTATVPAERWGELAPLMRRVVDSFRLQSPE